MKINDFFRQWNSVQCPVNIENNINYEFYVANKICVIDIICIAYV